jgi:hypothetical protein
MHRPLLVAIPLVLLAGCGGTPANQAAPAPGQPSAQAGLPIPNPPPANITVATADGRAEVRTGGAAPYPEGIPQYPGATADQNVTVSGGSAQGSGRIIGFRTADPTAQVISFYADAAGRAGYRVLTRMNTGPSAALVLQRNLNENVSITATRIGDFTQGSIVVAGPTSD